MEQIGYTSDRRSLKMIVLLLLYLAQGCRTAFVRGGSIKVLIFVLLHRTIPSYAAPKGLYYTLIKCEA